MNKLNPSTGFGSLSPKGTIGNKPRYFRPYHSTIAVTSQIATAGRVILHLVEVSSSCIVDAVIIVNAATVAGNVTIGLYGQVPLTTDSCVGIPLIAESASTAQSGASTAQIISFTSSTYIGAGKYYIAVEYSDATATYMRNSNQVQVPGWIQYYDRAGGYGALTNPCPVIVETGSSSVGCNLRVSS